MRLKYVTEYRDATGKMRRYFRRAGQPLVALPGKPGSSEFMQAYSRALEGFASVDDVNPIGASLIKRNEGCIYFLDDGAFIKIGFSTNFKRRMEEYRTHRADGFNLVAIIRDARPDDDKALRRRFHNLRARGDWFRKGPSLVAFLEKIKNEKRTDR